MIRIPIIIVAFYWSVVSGFAQDHDSTQYAVRRLSVEEVNLVSSYYHQNGNNAAVTGGTGSERLSDFATTINVKMARMDFRKRVNTYTFEMGVDTYSSASSDKIDPSTISSASSSDQRFYPSLAWSRQDEVTGRTIGANLSVSSEYDYLSIGGGVSFFSDSKDKSRQAGLRVQTYQDFITMIYPIELRSARKGGIESRNSYSVTWSCSQIINRRLQVLFLLDLAYQQGVLSMPFNRIYFKNNSEGIENLPRSRFKFPASVRMNYFLGDVVILRTFYRYYQDDWGLKGHTAEVETAVKITPFVSVSPFYRFYTQSQVDYFAGFKQHDVADSFYTSDYDLSEFNSHFAGLGFRFISPDGLIGIRMLNTLEIRYGHYSRQTGLWSNIVSLSARFK
jgi:hypothetical protein